MRQEPRATLTIGKAGVTEEFLAELRDQVRRRTTVKVRLLRTAPGADDRKQTFRALATQANVDLVKAVGFVAVYRRK